MAGAEVEKLLWVGGFHKQLDVQNSSAPESATLVQLEIQEGGALLRAVAGEFDE